MVAREYSFRKLTMVDQPLLMTWRARPHVSKWWASNEPYDQEELNDLRVARWIVTVDDRPFAFMQDYTVHGWEDHHFAQLPMGTRGIDQFIGDPKLIGLGHGTAFIGARMKVLFDDGAPIIATDPHPKNERAIAVYKKLGFEPMSQPQQTQWGLVLPMLAIR